MDCLTPAQVRAARAMLGWSLVDFANAARLSVATIQRYESGGDPVVPENVVALMQDAAETEGVRFLADDGNGPGVRFRRR